MISQRKPPPPSPVALLRIEADVFDTVARALELCQGLRRLRPSDQVLVKPNLLGLPTAYRIPPYGVVTTTAVIEGLVRALKDAGASRIALGDGGLKNEELGLSTPATMEMMGLPRLASAYGLTLVDLNQGPFVQAQMGGLSLRLSRLALESDFVVSLPVLKTHNVCQVSLALKNMKGCLHLRSKVACHSMDGELDRHVAELSRALYPDLALIDGRYALARGPMHTGQASRADLIIAARDALEADLAGAAVLGFDPARVDHLRLTAELLGRPCRTPEVVGGPGIEEVRLNLPHDWEWVDPYTPEPYARAGVKGFFLPKYDNTLCTGCSVMYNPALVMVLAAGAGKDLGGVELLTGKTTQPTGRAKTSILMGNCIIKHMKGDPRLGRPVLIPGCPPKLEDMVQGLNQAGVPAELRAYQGFMASLPKRYTEDKGFLAADFQPRGTA